MKRRPSEPRRSSAAATLNEKAAEVDSSKITSLCDIPIVANSDIEKQDNDFSRKIEDSDSKDLLKGKLPTNFLTSVASNVKEKEILETVPVLPPYGPVSISTIPNSTVSQPPQPRDNSIDLTKATIIESTFRIDPDLITGVCRSPDITHSATAIHKPEIDSIEPIGVSEVIQNFNKNCNPQPSFDRLHKSNLPLPINKLDGDTQVIIRRENVGPSRFCNRKPMSSFETPPPPLNVVNTEKCKAVNSIIDQVKVPSPKVLPQRRFETSPSANFDRRDEADSHRVASVIEVFRPASENQRKVSVDPKKNNSEMKPKPLHNQSHENNDDENSVSNVIKRFNDKCESIAENKRRSNMPEQALKHQSKSFNIKPSYATMDCRSKRNNSMTRGYTVTESAARSDSFRRQTSVGASSLAHSETGSWSRHRLGGFETLGHSKVRSKSQSAADDENKRSGCEYDSSDDRRSRGNVSSHRVRFDESSLRGCDQRKSSDKMARGRRDSDGDDDDDLFEKYETLV